jgi:sugar phosphate permease
MTRQSDGETGRAVTRRSIRDWLGSHRHYPWFAVALLWFCGFFNYTDRQALSAVLPAIKGEFSLTDEQIGWLGSAFMITYSLTSPFTGYAVDRLSRRVLIPLGLGFWSLICASTALARNYVQMFLLRGAEGLGESFYFPASMSVIAGYHSTRMRSRAMSIHQTSVYLGTAGGWYIGGALGERYGWQSPFWLLGGAGLVYAVFLGAVLIEPPRVAHDGDADRVEPDQGHGAPAPESSNLSLWSGISRIVRNPAAALLLGVFLSANFVAATYLIWLPSFVSRTFGEGLESSSLKSTLWPLASLPGALCGGFMADWAARRRKGGRVRVQALGLILAAPFVFATGFSTSAMVLMAALIGAGMCKGIYDANIFASLYDVIRPEDRGTGAGLMNTIGWTGASVAPVIVGFSSKRFGLGITIGSTAALYLLGGFLALGAAHLAERREPDPA